MYIFEFTSEYIKKPVRNSDEDRELLRKPAIISVKPDKKSIKLHNMLFKYAEEHVRCIAENTYI
jgi:hypothetical protein